MSKSSMMVVEDPSDISFTLTMTMKLVYWRTLLKQLEEGGTAYAFPASDLRDDINSMVRKAEAQFYPDSDGE